MVSTRSLMFKSSSPCTNILVTVPSTLITSSITFTFMFHSFFQVSGKVLALIPLFVLLQFYPVVSRNGKVHYSAGSLFLFLFFFFFFFFSLSLVPVVWPRLDDPFVFQKNFMRIIIIILINNREMLFNYTTLKPVTTEQFNKEFVKSSFGHSQRLPRSYDDYIIKSVSRYLPKSLP